MDILQTLAALEPVAVQDVVVELSDDLSPGVVKPAGESATRFTAVSLQASRIEPTRLHDSRKHLAKLLHVQRARLLR